MCPELFSWQVTERPKLVVLNIHNFFFKTFFMWTICKVFLEFVTMTVLCFGFLAMRHVRS